MVPKVDLAYAAEDVKHVNWILADTFGGLE